MLGIFIFYDFLERKIEKKNINFENVGNLVKCLLKFIKIWDNQVSIYYAPGNCQPRLSHGRER